jgi:predicted esterase
VDQPRSFSLPVRRTARYHTLGSPGKQVDRFIFACHGYGQLAGRFIHKFSGLLDGRTYVVAPEALSRFYLDGTYSEVGASWMTREDRSNEISDQQEYLSALYARTLVDLPDGTERILFGFSQGCPTLVRWIAHDRPHFHHLVLWGGDFPEDIAREGPTDFFSDKKITFVHGDRDPYVPPKQVERLSAALTGLSPAFAVRSFAGGHEVDRPFLREVLERP